MPDFRLILAMIGAAFFYAFPVLLLVFLFLLVRARRRGELAPPPALVAGWLLGVGTLGLTLSLLGGGARSIVTVWVALAVFVVTLVLCGRLLRSPLTRPLRIVSWALFFDTLAVVAFMPFAVWIANEALRVSAYSNTDEAAARAALVKNPNDAAAHSSLGHIEMMRGDHVAEVAEWQQVLRVEPGNEDALFLLGARLAHDGRADEARPLYQKLAAGNGPYANSARHWLARQGRR